MGRINEKYKYPVTPESNEKAIVKGENYRFTVLSDRLIRMEYSYDGKFEDRATRVVVNRNFDVPEFSVTHENGTLRIRTDSIELTYLGGEFSPYTLSARFAHKNKAFGGKWYFGEDKGNLKGTVRTLDGVNGECELENGIMSRSMTVLDDSNTQIIAEDGWIDVRNGKNIDMYLFAYRTDYKGALKDFYKLTGKTPLIPRYALGNWWSRYYAYTQDEYENLMLKFEEYDIPLSVAVMDMDWHYVKIDPKYGSGWTGFSWDKNLFPDHKGFLNFLHKHGLEVTLNLHPAEGISAHEDCYLKMAKEMGTENGETVEFDVTDPKFVENYFKEILNPMEEEGVSFWWMDWQQGSVSSIPGLDPLWMLNHYHYVDMCANNKRAMIFSRYAGPGSHRYPIGFSGDTIVTWESLDFQPYFTANAANIGYGWWSHDIGGHMSGIRDDELTVRWVQYGVFSPIMRLHSTCNDLTSKEPWNYNKVAEIAISSIMRLRHKLIPYLYSMNYRAYNDSMPLIVPLYYGENSGEAYNFNRNEYYFGSELIVSPITSKSDSVTQMGCARTYLPEGIWFDFFNNRQYAGSHSYNMYRDIYNVPVFARAGAIVPMTDTKEAAKNPQDITLHVFPCADGSFEMYEDDNISMNYQNGEYVKTKFTLAWGEKSKLVIGKPNGCEKLIVKDRKYTVVLRRISSEVTVLADNKPVQFETYQKDGNTYVEIENVNGEVSIEFNGELSKPDYKSEVLDILTHAQFDNDKKQTAFYKFKEMTDLTVFINELMSLGLDRRLFEAIVEIVSAK